MKKIFAYFYPRGNMEFNLDKFKHLDYVNYSFGHVKDGVLSTERLGQLDELVNLNGRNFKITLSIGGWGADGFSDAVIDDASINKFVSSIVSYMKEHKLDGIDIDWEYPGIPGGGIKARKEDKYRFTSFIKVLKEEMIKVKKDSILTIAVGAWEECARYLEGEKLDKYIDYLNIMTYDMQDRGMTISHHTNMYPSPYSNMSGSEAVDIFVKCGFTKEKMVLGSAFYGKCMSMDKTKKPAREGYPYKEIVNLEGYEYKFDDEAKAPLLIKGTEYITYDNRDSVKAKCDYINKYNLSGIMFWELNGDNGDLVDEMYKNLK